MSVPASSVPPITMDPPKGVPPYATACRDARFTPEIRNEIEDLCRRLINRRNKLKRDPHLNENQWFNERVQSDKGPLHMVSRFVRRQPVGDESFVLVLGAATGPPGKFAISTATYDYPWFTCVMNEFCNSTTDEAFNAWQLTFDKKGSIGAKALCDDSVAVLSNAEKDLLLNIGFRIPGHTGKMKKEPKSKKSKAKQKEELDPNDPLYDLHKCRQHFTRSWKKIRTLTRRIRMNAGMTSSRRSKVASFVEQFNTTFADSMARLKICREEKVHDGASSAKEDASIEAASETNISVQDNKRSLSMSGSPSKKARILEEKEVMEDPAAVGSEAVHDGYETDPEERGKGWRIFPPAEDDPPQ